MGSKRRSSQSKFNGDLKEIEEGVGDHGELVVWESEIFEGEIRKLVKRYFEPGFLFSLRAFLVRLT